MRFDNEVRVGSNPTKPTVFLAYSREDEFYASDSHKEAASSCGVYTVERIHPKILKICTFIDFFLYNLTLRFYTISDDNNFLLPGG